MKLTKQEEDAVLAFMKDAAQQEKWHLRRRGNAVLKSDKGLTIRQISRSMEVSPKTVWNWLNCFKQEGVKGLYDRPRQPKKLSEAQCQQLLRMRYPGHPKVMRRDRKWSYPKLAEWVKQNWQIEISPQRISQLIRKEIYG